MQVYRCVSHSGGITNKIILRFRVFRMQTDSNIGIQSGIIQVLIDIEEGVYLTKQTECQYGKKIYLVTRICVAFNNKVDITLLPSKVSPATCNYYSM